MKKEFSVMPDKLSNEQFYGFNWFEHLTAVPSPLTLVTGYKLNGRSNGTMQSWLSFSSDNGSDFYCIFSYICKYTHMYEIASKQKQLVINFPSADNYKKCYSTIANNSYEEDELEKAGLKIKKGTMVNAPVVEDCFLNLECEYVWEKEITPNSDHVVLCVKVVNVHIDEERLKNDRYGENGFLYNIHSPLDPATLERKSTALGVITPYKTYEEFFE